MSNTAMLTNNQHCGTPAVNCIKRGGTTDHWHKQLTNKQVDVVIIEQVIQVRQDLPHATADLTRRQTVDQRQ